MYYPKVGYFDQAVDPIHRRKTAANYLRVGDSPLLPSKINTSYPAKDCLPPGVEVVSSRVAKLTFDRLGNTDIEQSLSMA